MRRTTFATITAVGLMAAGCSSNGSTDNSTSQTPPTTVPNAAAAVGPSQKICRFTNGAGSYYLLLTSAADHNFTACSAGTAYDGTIDDLLGLPTMDRRCFLASNDYIIANDATGAIYSDTKGNDLATAKAECAAEGGTQN